MYLGILKNDVNPLITKAAENQLEKNGKFPAQWFDNSIPQFHEDQ